MTFWLISLLKVIFVLQEAYFKMAKLYHPDGETSTADPKKFDQIKQAYKSIKVKVKHNFV